ncbi:hypothetical protein Taro_029160 [Colocasia esculenta]|uniref:Integrator complex subunit 7 N-terminal domain-containing protein n=1 Tax=Colocasia esculenta TaxID=4460 RepID=A0A843VZF6_COLES|nr:hypothetical protein [Colocasia esculenta]
MEKVPAACAMEWSIQLEKGLRSRRPGQPVEVIEEVGTKLLKWSKETCITMSASMMYGLVPGEERSFANTILMRLADAFRSGDNCVRARILKIFLSEMRHIKQKGRSYDGLLTKQRLPNYLELLKRVRLVFDTDDVKARALSLRLLGCWAPLTHDNADVRCIILSRLRSGNVLEVKASIFASGCLCRISDDFACIFLRILVDIINSVNVSSSVKLAAAHAFGEIQCSPLVAVRAFKSGKKLVLESQIENHMVEMLSSLSKLAVKSVILVPEQKIDDPDLSLDLQCDILKTLRKLFNDLPRTWYYDTPEFPSLVMLARNASQSPNTTKRYMALGLLVDISCNAKVMKKESCSCTEQLSIKYASSQSEVSSENLFSVMDDAVLLARHVIFLLINYITFMTKNKGIETDSGTVFLRDEGFSQAANELKQKCSILLHHILRLIAEYPVLSLMVLDRLRSLIENLIHCHLTFDNKACHRYDVSEMEIDVDKTNNFSESGECCRGNHAVSEIILHVCSFTVPCLLILDENGLAGPEVCAVLKLLVDCLQKSKFCNSDACEMVSFKIHSSVVPFHCGIKESTMQMLSESELAVNPNLSEDNCWVHRERVTLGFARKMMGKRKHWMVYRVGKYSSHEGLWFAATYAFRKVIDEAKSESVLCWLKCLMLLAAAESEMKLLLFPKLGIKLISELCTDCGSDRSHEGATEERMADYDGGIASMHDKRERLLRVHKRICSAQEVLPVVGTLAGAFWFQRWFLVLRGRVFEILLDILGHLGPHFNNEKIHDTSGPGKESLSHFCSLSVEDINFLTSHFSCISFQLNKLAREYDFLTSFVDMDFKSSRMISRIALCCSLLAFCVGFHVYLSGLSCCESITSNVGCFGNFPSMLLDDLVGRLFYVYGMDATDLERYMPVGWLRGCLPSRKQISRFDHMDRNIIFVSRFAISSFQHLQQEAEKAKSNEDICGVFLKCLQLTRNILEKWMHFPFQAPKYFFRVRHCRGAELFVHNADAWNSGKLRVLPGNQLHLNVKMNKKLYKWKTRGEDGSLMKWLM